MSDREDARLDTWRLEACEAAGLPSALASRLKGTTREAVFTDARVLAAESKPEPTPTGEATALARLALKNAAAVREWGPGVMGGKPAEAPIELPQRTHPQRLERADD